MWIGVPQKWTQHDLLCVTHLSQGPQGFKTLSRGSMHKEMAKFGLEGWRRLMTQQSPSRGADPLVVIIQQIEKRRRLHRGELPPGIWSGGIRSQPINASTLSIPVVSWIHMRDPCVIPVGDVDGAIRADRGMHRTKPSILGLKGRIGFYG